MRAQPSPTGEHAKRPQSTAPMRVMWGGTAAEPGRRTFGALDGVRGFAVLAVMASHYERFLPTGIFFTPARAFLAYGSFGVDLFFVLSGFLITGILLQTRSSSNFLRAFYMRRVLRIFPIYYATLIVVFAAAAIVPAASARLAPSGERWLYFLYLENWIAVWKHAWPANAIGHFWSLAVEEQFYLVWPLCVLTCSRAALTRIAVGGIIAALAIRCTWTASAGPNDGIILATFSQMDALLAGALGAILYLRHRDGVPARGLLWWCIVPLVAFTVLAFALQGSLAFIESVGFSLLAVGFGAFILDVAVRDAEHDLVQRTLRNPALSRVGKYSYGMYVYHVPLLGGCELLIFDRLPSQLTTQPVFAIAYVCGLAVLTFVVAAISYELFERPILNLKRHFEPAFAASETTATSA